MFLSNTNLINRAYGCIIWLSSDHWNESLKTGIYSFTQLQETTISLHFVAWAFSLKLRICAKELKGRN